MKKLFVRGSFGALVLGVAVVSAKAATPVITGDVVNSGQLVSGINLKAGQDQNPDVQVYLESSGTLTSPLFVDDVPTAFNSSGDIPSGTAFTDYLLHYDYPGTTGGNNATGTVTFGSDIIGLIVDGQTLGDTDGDLGVSGVKYPANGGLESGDDWSVSGTQLTFNIKDWTTTSGADDVRVILAGGTANGIAGDVPDGGFTAALLGFSAGLLGMGRRFIFRQR